RLGTTRGGGIRIFLRAVADALGVPDAGALSATDAGADRHHRHGDRGAKPGAWASPGRQGCARRSAARRYRDLPDHVLAAEHRQEPPSAQSRPVDRAQRARALRVSRPSVAVRLKSIPALWAQPGNSAKYTVYVRCV